MRLEDLRLARFDAKHLYPHLQEPKTLDDLIALSGLEERRVQRSLKWLQANDEVVRTGTTYRMRSAYRDAI